MRHLQVRVFSLDGSANPLECYPKGFGYQSNRHSPFPPKNRFTLQAGWDGMGWDEMGWNEMGWDRMG